MRADEAGQVTEGGGGEVGSFTEGHARELGAIAEDRAGEAALVTEGRGGQPGVKFPGFFWISSQLPPRHLHGERFAWSPNSKPCN
jgi:hypothetical protein